MSSWTDERVEILRKLWAEGMSASQIAGELGGVTRNAVIGKRIRLGLPERKTKIGKPKSKRTRKPKTLVHTPDHPSIQPLPKDVLFREKGMSPTIPKSAIPLQELGDGQCRHPYGLKNYRFCGKPVREGCSYCDECYELNHVKGGAHE